jgi:hypothetical protein
MAKQSSDHQLGKPYLGRRSGEPVQHLDRKIRGVAV